MSVVWKNRRERWWAHFLLEWTEAQIRFWEALEKR